MKISRLGRRRQSQRVYRIWSVKFLSQMYPRTYARDGRKETRRVIADCIYTGTSGGGARVFYDRSWCEKGRELALTRHIKK